MTPTNKLRFVERVIKTQKLDLTHNREDQDIKVRILQQWWQPTLSLGWADVSVGAGEWRDIPLEKEE